MRLIGQIDSEKDAYLFYLILSKQGIQASYEAVDDPQLRKRIFQVWVYDEEELEQADSLFKEFQKNPKQEAKSVADVRVPPPEPPPPLPSLDNPKEEVSKLKVKINLNHKRSVTHPLNNFVILLCVVLFFWNGFQEKKIAEAKGLIATQIIFTPIQENLLIDYPQSMQYLEQVVKTYPLKDIKDFKELPPGAQALIKKSEEAPSWKGFFPFFMSYPKKGFEALKSIPMFEKVREGEVWRLFTPTLLHRDFLHILFNMAWLWILGAQIEQRAGKWRYLLLVLIVGIVSNVAQYLVSGPFFLGFSGVVVGMAGFIWVRQKMAPWEGYPLNRATVVFILLFVLAMFVLEVVAVALQLLGVTEMTPNIANTAHIVGGLTGMLLGRIPLFSRGGGG